MLSFGNKRSYEDFKKQIPDSIKPLFDALREFCLSLDKKVIEDIRMHRVVFCKSMTFRWFADMEPNTDKIIIKIQKDRKTTPIIIEIKTNHDVEENKKYLQDAFNNIR